MPGDQKRASRHLLPHFTRGDDWRSDGLVVIDRGEGCYVWDDAGTEYLDGLAGLFCTNIGHGRSDLTAAAAKQMEKLAFYPNWGFAHPPAIEAASLIARAAPGDIDRVFFVSSGSEAVESALKFARCYHLANGDDARHKVVAREWSYHGTTLGSLALTGIPNFRDPYLPMLPDIVLRVPNTLDHGPRLGHPDHPNHSDQTGRAETAAAELDCVRAIEEAILHAGPETVAMVIAEPVQNGRGALVPPKGYWQELRRICDTYGVLLCADEVINSFGRLGHWFASERFDAQPDMITFAKGVTSAYQPLGGLAVRAPLVDRVWDSPLAMFLHGSTFGGHPVATAVAAANITAMRDEEIPANVLRNENHLGTGLRALMDAHACVKDVRGTGYFYAIELMRDRDAAVDFTDAEVAQLIPGGVLGRFVRDARVLVRPDGRGAVMLMVSPPLIADTTVLDDLLSRLDQVLNSVDAWLKNPT